LLAGAAAARRHLLTCLLLVGLACRTPDPEQHLRTELSFLVPYVDLEQEEKAVRGAFTQRRLLVDEAQRGGGFVALSASSIDHKRSAVRVVTRRGVVLGEDADADDWFALAEVALIAALTPADAAEPLVGVRKTARGHGQGCIELLRLLPDGRALPVALRVDRFGTYACVSQLRPAHVDARGSAREQNKGQFTAQLAWPALAGLSDPTLEIELAFEQARPGRPADPSPPLQVVEDGEWLDRESARLAQSPPNATFSARHALGIARAALALASGRSTDVQVGTYREALGRVPSNSPESELVAATTAHIAHGWSDSEPEQATKPEAADAPPDPDALVIEPEPR
jgi:hypothetical protein